MTHKRGMMQDIHYADTDKCPVKIRQERLTFPSL